MSFTVIVTDAQDGVCERDFEMEIDPAAPFSCGATPTNIVDAVWSLINPFPGPCTEGDIINGVCSDWSIYQVRNPADPCFNSSESLVWEATICNPGAAYDITVSAGFASFGNVYLPPPTDPVFSLVLGINIGTPGGYSVQSPFSSLINDLPNPLVASITLPAMAVSVLRVSLITNAWAAPPNGYWILNAGDLTVLPLTHP